MNIRSATDADCETIARIHAASWADSYRAYIAPGYYAELDARLAQHWSKLELGREDILLLAESELPLGFILVRDGDPAFINTLHVLPTRRSGGAGARLMCEAARRLQDRGRNAAYLDVIADNHRAIAFYRKLGGVPGAVKAKPVGDASVPNLRIDFPDVGTIIGAS